MKCTIENEIMRSAFIVHTIHIIHYSNVLVYVYRTHILLSKYFEFLINSLYCGHVKLYYNKCFITSLDRMVMLGRLSSK